MHTKLSCICYEIYLEIVGAEKRDVRICEIRPQGGKRRLELDVEPSSDVIIGCQASQRIQVGGVVCDESEGIR